MIRIAVIFSLLLSVEAVACPKLVGTWRSSQVLSLEYNLKNVEMEPHTIKFMRDVFGVLTLTYTKNAIRMHGAPTKKITIKGKEHDFVYEEMTFSYEIKSCTKNSLIILSDSPYSTGEDVLNFINPNVYWVPSMPGSEKREYFERLPKDIYQACQKSLHYVALDVADAPPFIWALNVRF